MHPLLISIAISEALPAAADFGAGPPARELRSSATHSRHARACPGHPRKQRGTPEEDVDSRDSKSGHDDKESTASARCR